MSSSSIETTSKAIAPEKMVSNDLKPSTEKKTDWGQAFGLREMGVFYALLLLVIILSIATAYLGRANYLSVLNVTNVMYQASLTSFMAIAMTVVLITGNFDLSVASVAAFSAALFVGTARRGPAFCTRAIC